MGGTDNSLSSPQPHPTPHPPPPTPHPPPCTPHPAAAFQNQRRIRMYDVHGGWRLLKDVHARNLRWTVTDTTLSSDQRFLLYSSITPVVHLVSPWGGGGG